MLTPGASLFMFASSFAPLLLLFAIRTDRADFRWSLAILAITFSGLAVVVLAVAKRTTPVELEIAGFRPRDAEVVSYLVTYLLPFLMVRSPNFRDMVALGLFLSIIGILYVRSNMIYVNPLLALIGYHLYAIAIVEQDRGSAWLLTKKEEGSPGHMLAVKLVGNVWIEKEG